jgi:hypothetical protein
MSESVNVTFLFRKHQRVHIAGHIGTVYTVRERQYREREIMPPYCEYFVAHPRNLLVGHQPASVA